MIYISNEICVCIYIYIYICILYIYIYINYCSHFVRGSIQQCSMRNTHHLQLQNSFCGSWLSMPTNLLLCRVLFDYIQIPSSKTLDERRPRFFGRNATHWRYIWYLKKWIGHLILWIGTGWSCWQHPHLHDGIRVIEERTNNQIESKQWPEPLIFLPVLLVLSHTCSNEWPINFQNSQGINDEACPRLKNVIEYLNNPTWTRLNATRQELVKQLPEGRIRGETSWPGYWQRNVEWMIWLRHESWFDNHIQLVCKGALFIFTYQNLIFTFQVVVLRTKMLDTYKVHHLAPGCTHRIEN